MPLSLREALATPGHFSCTYELVPGQGTGSKQVERLLAFAHQASADGRICALSITDNAGGHPALAPGAIGADLLALGLDPLVHFSLKDKNRNQVESDIFLYHRLGIHSLLVLGGDYPSRGYAGQARGVFDLDSVQALQMLQDVEQGNYRSGSGIQQDLLALSFLRGCVVSPFKATQAEQVWQYGKLLRKIRAGAQFVVTQLGYDLERFRQLLEFLHRRDIRLPVLANVFIPSLAVARHMARGQVPGVLFPPDLLRVMEEEQRTGQGNEQRLRRAALMIAALRDMGCAGVHLGGNGLDFPMVARVLDMAERYAASWREEVHAVQFSLSGGVTSNPSGAGRQWLGWQGSRLAHGLLFEEANPIGHRFGQLCRQAWGRPRLTRLLLALERWTKGPLFGCRLCGDCTLGECGYLCPQSGCPKRLLNGPCGGSRLGYCEVHSDRLCFWVRQHVRTGATATEDELGNGVFLPPKDWALEGSCSWINFFTGRDHRGRKKQHTAWQRAE